MMMFFYAPVRLECTRKRCYNYHGLEIIPEKVFIMQFRDTKREMIEL